MPSTRATEHEWSLLTAACSLIDNDRIKHLATLPTQWDVLFELAEHHGVQPLLYQALLPAKAVVPPEHFNRLAQKYQANVHKALMLSRELFRILDRLSADAIDVMPYKGLALAEAVYGDIALRQSGDIDLLIHAADLTRLREAVKELGYVPHDHLSVALEQEYLKSGYEFAFDGPAGRNLLEVQWAIQPRFYAVDLAVDQLFHRCVTASVAGRSLRTLSLEDSFIVLAVHAAKHVWGRLIWLCDLARIIQSPALNWKMIASQAERLGIVRLLRVTLLLSERVLNTPMPLAADEAIPNDSRAGALASEIEPHIFREDAFDTESPAYFRLMLRLRERRVDQARFLTRLILTPGPGEWDVVQLPRVLFPLYRLVRLGRLAARMVRA